MGLGFVVLRLSPRDFWSMSPLELSAALTALELTPKHAMARDDLLRLMQQFPDGSSARISDGR